MSLNYLAIVIRCSWPWRSACCSATAAWCAAAPIPTPSACSATRAPPRLPASGPVRWRRSCARISTRAGRASVVIARSSCRLAPTSRFHSATSRSRRSRSASYVECTAACNISCNQAVCAPETGITRTRQAGMLDFDLFTKVIDEAGPSLGRIDFFNYGEAFLHKRAVEMCEYIKTKFPHIYLYTSTNGLAFTEEKVRQLARSGIDEVTFSLDGASQETVRAIPPARQLREGDRQPARPDRRARQERPQRAVRELALHPLQVERFRRRDEQGARDGRRHRHRSAGAGRSRITRRIRSRAASRRARPTTSASATRSGTTAASATRSPAPRRAPKSTSTPCCRTCRS